MFHYRVQENTTLLHYKNNLFDGVYLNNRCLLRKPKDTNTSCEERNRVINPYPANVENRVSS